jgi:4-hydroxyphenylpyruvate dioxygenase-like putative hemolysin
VSNLKKTKDFLENVIGIPAFKTYQGAAGPGIKDSIIALSQAGGVEIELVEIIEGKSIHTEYIEQHGPGIHHLAFFVSELDSVIEAFAQRNIGVLMKGVSARGIRYAYMDTADESGVIFELIEREK